MVIMDFKEAIILIKSFWKESQFPFGSSNLEDVARLEKEFGLAFPAELKTYLADYAPDLDFHFEAVGNSIQLYTPRNISSRLEGYNWNPVTSVEIDGWLPAWFLIGDQGADPVMVDLAIQGKSCRVHQAIHGIGSWDFSLISPSIPIYMVLISAQHHALTGFGKRVDAITDDENGFNLMEPAANWYFPFVKALVPELYNHWTESFDNANRI
jgi:cell wall assembly regulator SMI1